MRINTPFALSLVAYAVVAVLFACDGASKKTKKIANGIRGNGSKSEPFTLDASQLPGIYLVQSYGSGAQTGDKQLWKLTANTADVIKPKVEGCGERSYTVEGNVLKFAATARCAADQIEVVEQRSDALAIKTSPFVLQGQMSSVDTISLTPTSAAAAGEAVYSWDVELASLPAWLQTFVLSEASAAEVAAARGGFKDAMPGSTVALKGNFKELLSVADPERKILTFKNGKALHHWYDRAKETSPVTCYVSAKNADADQLAAGFSWKLASLDLEHSRRVQGKWTLAANGTEAEADNPQRKNAVSLKLEGAPEGFAVTCTKDKGPQPLTLGEVKAAFGSYLEITR